jgi:hypothetical protein
LNLDPRDYKFKAPANFSLDAKPQSTSIGSRSAQNKKALKGEKSAVVMNTINNTKRIIPRGESAASNTSEKDVKQLLGELYSDKEYLEQFLNDKGWLDNAT